MTDGDLEARLRTHLHQRFDSADPSRELLESVRQAVTTTPRPVGLTDLRIRPIRLGWSVVGVAAVLAIVALVAANLGRQLGPGAATPPPSSTIVPEVERWFVVMSTSGAAPSKSESGLAADILTERVKALGFGNFTSAVGYGIEFILPASGPSDEATRRVLKATGDVTFVPLPPSDYGEGKLTAEVGKPLPKDEPALFGWDGIASVVRKDTESGPAIAITLRPAVKVAFGDYTSMNLGEIMAVLIDGNVAALPTINEPITTGEISITWDAADADGFAEFAAILIGGMLPASWQHPSVPVIIDRETAIGAAVGAQPAASVESAEVNVIAQGTGWRAVWNIVLTGDFPGGCPPPAVESSRCPSATSQFVVLDATSGALISSSSEAPGS